MATSTSTQSSTLGVSVIRIEVRRGSIDDHTASSLVRCQREYLDRLRDILTETTRATASANSAISSALAHIAKLRHPRRSDRSPGRRGPRLGGATHFELDDVL